MLDEGTKFHINFDLPDRVKHSSNDVRLQVAYFAPWNMPPSTVQVALNGQVLKNDHVKGEHQGRTVSDIDVPHHLLNLCGSGKSNKISLTFIEGSGVIFLWFFKVSAKLSDEAAPATPVFYPAMEQPGMVAQGMPLMGLPGPDVGYGFAVMQQP